jgi:hypothetical protein
MTNRLKMMGESIAWRLMVDAALQGARGQGYELKRRPGRGLSNTYIMTKDGGSQSVSLRTTRDRWVAFPPLDDGKRWKTLDDVDMVLVSAVDNRLNPQNVEVYLFPGDEVRKRFNASYAARVGAGHTVRNDYGMWVPLDKGLDDVPSQVGHSLAVDYPPIARFTLNELEAGMERQTKEMVEEASVQVEEVAQSHDGAVLATVADVLTFAREKIASLTGMPADTIKLDIKMGV